MSLPNEVHHGLSHPDSNSLLSIPYHIDKGDLKDFIQACVTLQKEQPEFVEDMIQRVKSFQEELKTKTGLDRTIHKITFIICLLVIALSSIRNKEKKEFFDRVCEQKILSISIDLVRKRLES